MFVGSAVLNMLAVRAMDTVMLHVLLNGYGWGALYETTNDFQGGTLAVRKHADLSNHSINRRPSFPRQAKDRH